MCLDMAAEKGDDLFISRLNEVSLKRARDELNERNPEDRKQAVQEFRKWIRQQAWLTTPTDFEFLLRFLRVRKFSQLGARDTLENYMMNRIRRPAWHTDIDPADPILQEILRAKTYYSPKIYDRDGCRWIYTPFGSQTVDNLKKWGLTNVYRVMVLFLEWLCYDENVQVNGIKWFIDFTGLTMGAVLMKYTRPEDKNCVSQLFQKSTPMRMKEFYPYNEPAFFDVIYKMASMFTRPKLLDRIKMLGKNMANIYEKIDMSILPDEYLPDDYDGPSAGTETQIIEDMLKDMVAPKFRTHIREVTSSKYGINLTKKPKCSEAPVASFRLLAMD